MNVNTWDAEPLHEEVLHVSKVRVFEDGNGRPWSTWFELEPGQFWCGPDRREAEGTRRDLPSLGQTEERLRVMFPHGSFTTNA